jgi:signal transduction histidine kinase
VRVRAERSNGNWKVVVRDNGIGIDPGDVPRLFTVFARLHAKGEHPGHGVGLAVCRRIIERHSGSIGCEPVAGRGTAIWFTLPAGEEPP